MRGVRANQCDGLCRLVAERYPQRVMVFVQFKGPPGRAKLPEKAGTKAALRWKSHGAAEGVFRVELLTCKEVFCYTKK